MVFTQIKLASLFSTERYLDYSILLFVIQIPLFFGYSAFRNGHVIAIKLNGVLLEMVVKPVLAQSTQTR